MSKELQQKLNSRGRHQLESGNFSGIVEVLIRTQRPLNSDQKQQMRQAGCRLRSIMGNVLTGMVTDVEHLENVAQLPFVCQMELSTPMFQEA